MAEAASAFQFTQQHTLAILDDCLTVWSFLQILADLRHDVGVEGLQQYLVAPSLFATLEILKYEG
jgi:cytochrome c oxidase subunit IV